MRRLLTAGVNVALALLALSLSVPTLIGQDGDYEAAQKVWRATREAKLMTDDGWLTMAALHFLREEPNSFDTSPLNDLVLPEGPEQAGVFVLRNDEVFLRATEGQTLIVNAEPVTAMQLYPTESTRQSLTIGDRLAVRMSDPNSEIRKGPYRPAVVSHRRALPPACAIRSARRADDREAPEHPRRHRNVHEPRVGGTDDQWAGNDDAPDDVGRPAMVHLPGFDERLNDLPVRKVSLCGRT